MKGPSDEEYDDGAMGNKIRTGFRAQNAESLLLSDMISKQIDDINGHSQKFSDFHTEPWQPILQNFEPFWSTEAQNLWVSFSVSQTKSLDRISQYAAHFGLSVVREDQDDIYEPELAEALRFLEDFLYEPELKSKVYHLNQKEILLLKKFARQIFDLQSGKSKKSRGADKLNERINQIDISNFREIFEECRGQMAKKEGEKLNHLCCHLFEYIHNSDDPSKFPIEARATQKPASLLFLPRPLLQEIASQEAFALELLRQTKRQFRKEIRRWLDDSERGGKSSLDLGLLAKDIASPASIFI